MRYGSQMDVLPVPLVLAFGYFYTTSTVSLMVTWRTILRLGTISLSGVHAEI